MARKDRSLAWRSPIKGKSLRRPGQSLGEQLDDILYDRFISDCMMALFGWVFAILLWLFYLCRIPYVKAAVTASVVAVGMTGFAAVRFVRIRPHIRALRLGMQGEIAVGQFLDENVRTIGYRVYHDIVGGGFNVDHVLIGPGGVFAIETKTHSKPGYGQAVITYDGSSILVDGLAPDRDPVAQARASAAHIRELLFEGSGRKVFVRPVILYPVMP
jgi:hypothetical protein